MKDPDFSHLWLAHYELAYEDAREQADENEYFPVLTDWMIEEMNRDFADMERMEKAHGVPHPVGPQFGGNDNGTF